MANGVAAASNTEESAEVRCSPVFRHSVQIASRVVAGFKFRKAEATGMSALLIGHPGQAQVLISAG